uniref:ATP synthase complex subunit 8 n=1 Tax=Macrophthalmus pacificus TaxID=220126 RepID=A0A6B9XQJ1_9EUCA|nr:ATP synthase F0 subunit 8 [Macrophthalmus pacificus]QHR85458.1 ATP synthase F0 subunit 8 [Macrophthalmus pacificus]
MPQMAPILWLPMFLFFILFLYIFIILNFFIKPFNKIQPIEYKLNPTFKSWKL